MKSAYYDSAFLFKIFFAEVGSDRVQVHASALSELVCGSHGRVEFASTCHRKVREGSVAPVVMGILMAQMKADSRAGGIRWLPITDAVVSRAEAVYASAPADVFLRAADALHLACAAVNGYSDVYSSDRHLLRAASLFGLKGVDLTT